MYENEVYVEEKKKDKKKAAAAILAIICILSLLIGGTFAWYRTANALNKFEGENDQSVVLHDDFDEKNEYGDEEDEYIKKVYVENAGTTRMFVRVYLAEYFDNGPQPQPQDADVDDYTTWSKHHSHENSDIVDDCDEETFHDYYEWIMGASDDYKFRRALDDEKTAKLAQRYYKDDGVTEKWNPETDDVIEAPDQGDIKDGEAATGDPRIEWEWDTAKACDVVSMSDYMSASFTEDKTTWKGWILDTDGYAYWSQKLEPGEATGLLLSQVNQKDRPQAEEFFYGIWAVLEAVDEEDIESWVFGFKTAGVAESDPTPGEATDNAIEFLKSISAKDDFIDPRPQEPGEGGGDGGTP